MMVRVESLQRDILGLYPAELAELRAWFLDQDWEAWSARQSAYARGAEPDPSADQGGREHASSRTTNVLALLVTLAPSDRIDIALTLWDSLRDSEIEALCPLTAEQEAELTRRLEDAINHPDEGIPWEEARQRILDGADITRLAADP